MAVIRPSIETDPAALEQIAFDYLNAAIPGWEPADGDLMTWLISAHARMVAEERDIAADVPLEQILRPLGEEVHRILPRVAAAATVDATVTLRDTKGYTVPAGMEVLVRTAGDDGVTMIVTESVTVPPPRDGVERDTASVTLRAAPGREGSGGNGLDEDSEAVPIRAFEFIESIELNGVSSGGRDAETDEQYLQRLVDTLALTSPVPILPRDFAGIALQHPAVARALAIDRHLWRPEIIAIKVTGTIGYIADGATRVQLTPSLTLADVEEEFADWQAVATGGPTLRDGITLTLDGRTDYGPWKAESSGPSTAGVSVLQRGGRKNPKERAIAVAVVNAAGARLADVDRAAVQESIEALREVNWECSILDPTYTDIDVAFRAVAWSTHDRQVVQDTAVEALRTYLSPARWGTGEGRGETADGTWVDEPFVRYLEVAQVLNEVPGLRYVTELTIGRRNGTMGRDDIELDGIAALPRPGANVGGLVAEG